MQDSNKQMNTNPTYGGIRCPRCGSSNLEFVTEYHKCIWLRIVVTILVVLLGVFVVRYLTASISGRNGADDMRAILIIAVFYILFQLSVWLTESKTHVQGICRDCGNIWLLN